MLGDSIGINKLCSSSSEKKKGKKSKIAIFGPNLHKKGVNMDHVQLSETFYFIKMYIFWLNNESFLVYYLQCFFIKKGSFLANMAVINGS